MHKLDKMMAELFSLLLCLSSLLLLFNLSDAEATNSVIVKTKYGDIQGRIMSAPLVSQSAITKFNMFLGIPFAAPPVGELRFQPPKPPKAWKPKILNAIHFSKICLQKRVMMMEQIYKQIIPNFAGRKDSYSEDCLYLNVFTPAQNDSLNPTTKYPVMFYIHGGGFVGGSGSLSLGHAITTYGVVLVTIQYRLGPFGFLSSGDSIAPGNYGMLDQIQALKWVKENIKNFGGDPNKVTIFGLSAGGASVDMHLLSPLSRNLFHGAISESGVSLCSWALTTTQEAKGRTMQLAKTTGCNQQEAVEMIECLKKKDGWDLLSSNGVYWPSWAPVVDKINGADAFLPDSPHVLRRDGYFKKIPYIIGFTPNEGAYFLPQIENMTANMTLFKKLLKSHNLEALNVTEAKQGKQALQDSLEFQYTPWGETADPVKLRQGIVDSFGDRMFVAPSVQACKDHSAHAKTYLFLFNHRSKYHLGPKWMGITHSDNFVIEFGFPFILRPPFNNIVDKNVSHLMMTMYTNFAKFGNPTPAPLPNGVQWSLFNTTSHAYLEIQPNPVIQSNFHPHRMAFWNEFYPQLVKTVQSCTKGEDKTNQAVRLSSLFPITAALLVACIFFLVL